MSRNTMMGRDITVYSRYGTDQPAKWQGTVLTGVFYGETAAEHLTAAGVGGDSPGLSLRIPLRGGRRSRAQLEAAEDKTGLFTLLPGDFIAPGIFPQGAFTGELRQAVPEARRVKTVTERRYGTAMDHWEVETG